MKRFLILLLIWPFVLKGTQLSWYGPIETLIDTQPCWEYGVSPSSGPRASVRNSCSASTTVSFTLTTNSANPIIAAGNYRTWYKANVIPQTYGQAFIDVNAGGTTLSAAIGGPTTE